MSIRTPDDEVNKPGWFLPPFREGWNYQGATYPGHSDFSVDWNRRTLGGGWLQDDGDPVLAAADGTVAEVDPREGLVMLSHPGGYQTEYRHMRDILVKKGQKVQRSTRLGSIGNVAGDGRSFGAHLHHVHWRNGKRIQMRFGGEPVATSVSDSDTRPAGWTPPPPVAVVGPPPRATWEGAYREAQRALDKATVRLEAQKAQTQLATDERDQARRDLAACQATQADCGPVQAALDAAEDRIVTLETIIEAVRRAVAA